MPSEVCIRQ